MAWALILVTARTSADWRWHIATVVSFVKERLVGKDLLTRQRLGHTRDLLQIAVTDHDSRSLNQHKSNDKSTTPKRPIFDETHKK